MRVRKIPVLIAVAVFSSCNCGQAPLTSIDDPTQHPPSGGGGGGGGGGAATMMMAGGGSACLDEGASCGGELSVCCTGACDATGHCPSPTAPPDAGSMPDAGTSVSNGAPLGIAVDSTSVYWTNPTVGFGPRGGDNSIMKAGLDGSAPIRLATGTNPYGVAVDATTVYWVDADNGAASTGAVRKVSKSGGAAETL